MALGMDPWSIGLLAWLTKRLWTPRPTHQVLGLPRPIAARVLEILEPIDTDTPPELAEQIRADAHDVFWVCLRAGRARECLPTRTRRPPHRASRSAGHGRPFLVSARI